MACGAYHTANCVHTLASKLNSKFPEGQKRGRIFLGTTDQIMSAKNIIIDVQPIKEISPVKTSLETVWRINLS